MEQTRAVVPLAEVERRILTLRGQRVMLDHDLAELYGITTKRLNEQVRRNPGRFPPDFMFQLSAEEASALRSQIATSKPDGSNALNLVSIHQIISSDGE